MVEFNYHRNWTGAADISYLRLSEIFGKIILFIFNEIILYARKHQMVFILNCIRKLLSKKLILAIFYRSNRYNYIHKKAQVTFTWSSHHWATLIENNGTNYSFYWTFNKGKLFLYCIRCYEFVQFILENGPLRCGLHENCKSIHQRKITLVCIQYRYSLLFCSNEIKDMKISNFFVIRS